MKIQNKSTENTSNHIHQEEDQTNNSDTHKRTLHPMVKLGQIFWTSTRQQTPAIEKRATLAYPALKRIYPLIAKNSKLKRQLKIIFYLICIRPVITYDHQVWAAAATTHLLKT